MTPFHQKLKGMRRLRHDRTVLTGTDHRNSSAGRMRWLLHYSITFTAACLTVYILHIFYGRTFIYTQSGSGDGLLQHYTALMYYGKWLRGLFKQIFLQHRFCVQNWDMGIGLGADVIATLHYYGLGDPLNLLSVFVPARYTEVLYHILVILRLYLAGITFWIYCRSHNYEDRVILPGAVIYVFSFYTIVLSVLHPFFLNPLIYFPLVLLGIDRVMVKGKPAVFLLSCMLAAYANFYFFYMVSVLMVLYAVMRYVVLFQSCYSWKHLFGMFGKFVCYYVAAVAAALPVLYPSADLVLSGERVGQAAKVPVLYEPIYYLKLVIAFVNASADHYAALGYTSVGLLAVILLFVSTGKKEKLLFKTAFVLGLLFLAFPICGHVLNGFGYATNRWVWAFCFVVALIVVDRMPQMASDVKKLGWAAAGGMLLFALPTFWYRIAADRTKMMVSAAVLVCACLVSAVFLFAGTRGKDRQMHVWVYTGLIFVNLFLNMFGFYSPYAGNDIENHGKAGMAYRDRMDGFYQLLDERGIDTDDARTDTVHLGFDGAQVNAAMLYGRNGTSFYFSMNHNSSSSMMRDLQIPVSTDIIYTDLDGRAMAEALLGCRYCVVRQGEEQYLPYGYDKIAASGDGYAVYESPYALPLVYSYHSYMDREAYDSLTAVQKQQALLQACVLEEDQEGIHKVNTAQLDFSDLESPVAIEADAEGIRIEENRIYVSTEGASLRILADDAEDSERYLAFKNLSYSDNDLGIATIAVTDGQMEKRFQIRSTTNGQYTGIHDFMCNLGYRSKHAKEYSIRFWNAGIYAFDSIKIVDQPMREFGRMTAERKNERIVYSVEEDAIKIEAEFTTPGIVYAAVPYHKKWKAYIDGVKTECVRTNRFGIGVDLSEGKHQVEFRYEFF